MEKIVVRIIAGLKSGQQKHLFGYGIQRMGTLPDHPGTLTVFFGGQKTVLGNPLGVAADNHQLVFQLMKERVLKIARNCIIGRRLFVMSYNMVYPFDIVIPPPTPRSSVHD